MTTRQIEDHTQALEQLVRETGYNIAVIDTAGSRGYDYSRAYSLYELACASFRNWAKVHQMTERAESFIAATYKPGVVAV